MTIEDRVADLERKVSTLEGGAVGLAQHMATDIEPKVAALEGRAGTLETRAGALEVGVAALGHPPPAADDTPSFFDRVMAVGDLLGKVAIPLVVLGITWAVKDSVDAALKERELEISAGKAMQEALVTLRSKTNLSQEAADAAALVLASMGRPSIMVLIREYDVGTTEASVAVGKALLMLGLTHQSDLCAALATVLRDSGKRFRIQTHALAATNLGQAQCRDQAKVLQDVKASLANPAAYDEWFNVKPEPASVKDLREKVENALVILAR